MKPTQVTEYAYAKVNLTLHVTGQREDGYHLLDSLVVFADVGDLLSVAPADDLSLAVTGPRAAGVPADGSNLVLKAARRLQALRGVTAGAAITLEKHLPHGGGIGGGSSDAATAIRLLSQLWQVAPLTAAEALPLGADLPVCLAAPAPTIMRGIGQVLTPAPALPNGWLVLVNPGIAVPTVAVFKAHDALYGCNPLGLEGFAAFDNPLTTDAFASWLLGQCNDLTKVVQEDQFAPVIGDILDTLRGSTGLQDADMSGSGSTCWGWFGTEADAKHAALRIGMENPGWWVVAARVLRPDDHLIRATT